MFFDKTYMQRHISFKNPTDIQRFMIGKVPSHSYYSTSYYRRPDAPIMDEKGWMGAELIFDLDADHLNGAKNMTYAEMLLKIRNEMIILVDSFLLGDLGFSEEQINITFSGGRGYHAHIKSPDIVSLGTHERGELVDYITGSGLSIDWIFPINKVVTSRVAIGSNIHVNIVMDRLIPSEDSKGWKLKMRNGLISMVDNICNMNMSSIRGLYPSVSDTSDSKLLKVKDELNKFHRIMFQNNTMAFLSQSTQDILIKIMSEDIVSHISGKIDRPVTADIKRLIRLPGSIHGKSGLRVTPITRDELTNFDPLHMAVPKEYSDNPIKITMRQNINLKMMGENFNLRDEVEVPEFAAVFLISRKMADIGFMSERTKQIDCYNKNIGDC